MDSLIEKFEEAKKLINENMRDTEETVERFRKTFHNIQEGSSSPDSKWMFAFASVTFRHLNNLFRSVNWIVSTLSVIYRNTELKDSKLDKELKKLTEEITKHEPIINMMNQAFLDTKDYFKENC